MISSRSSSNLQSSGPAFRDSGPGLRCSSAPRCYPSTSKRSRMGGHSNTVDARVCSAVCLPVNRASSSTIPEPIRILSNCSRSGRSKARRPICPSAFRLTMSAPEYSSSGLFSLFGQPANLVRPRFGRCWPIFGASIGMRRRGARRIHEAHLTLGEYLAQGGYGAAFRGRVTFCRWRVRSGCRRAGRGRWPIHRRAFIRFHDNHGLLQLRGRPI